MNFNEHEFKQKVDDALKVVKKVLDTERNPQYPADVAHRYDDKYGLAEYLTNTALAAQLNVLARIGVTPKQLAQMREWARTRSVTLRLSGEERCKFLRKETRKVESDTEVVDELKIGKLKVASFSSKKVTKVTDYFYQFNATYEVSAYRGNEPHGDTKLVIRERSSQVELRTGSDSLPYSSSSTVGARDCSITWLLQQIDDDLLLRFAIDRQQRGCATPRRNPSVYQALSALSQLSTWMSAVHSYLSSLYSKQQDHKLDMPAINSSAIFVPVLPLFEEAETRGGGGSLASSSAASSSASSSATPLASLTEPVAAPVLDEDAAEPVPVVLTLRDINSFLDEQQRSIGEKFAALAKQFPDDQSLIAHPSVCLSALALHARDIVAEHARGIDYIEHMLRTQLIAAIGKVVTPVDFAEYMSFHNRKLFRKQFAPLPFAYSVRRPDHCPEGTVGVEAQLADGSMAQPILTSAAVHEPSAPMHFALDAATNVHFYGPRYVHTYVLHAFSGQGAAQQIQLTARARQFSGFVMLVGRIASARLFEPMAAMIVQNKDDLSVPLMLETLPTPKEFRDAIESLSPEQQAFCKAYRSMQLESTLFAVCIVQIKPQLERLLKLDEDALTKEIRLTQDLLELFIEYHIPSDLLSYDGPDEASVERKLARVKELVAAMKEMIEEKRQDQLAETGEEALFTAVSSMDATVVSVDKDGEGSSYTLKQKKGGKWKADKGKRRRRSGRVAASSSSSSPSSSSSSSSSGQSGTQSSVNTGAKPGEHQPQQDADTGEDGDEEGGLVDFTQVPAALDDAYSRLDEDNALRPTIIKPAHSWRKTAQRSLLSAPVTVTLGQDELRRERQRAYDLLDALSRSGALEMLDAELHIIIAATHSFDKCLLETVVQDNINPIEKVERSTLIMASTVHGRRPIELIKLDQLERVQLASPSLFNDDDNDDNDNDED